MSDLCPLSGDLQSCLLRALSCPTLELGPRKATLRRSGGAPHPIHSTQRLETISHEDRAGQEVLVTALRRINYNIKEQYCISIAEVVIKG